MKRRDNFRTSLIMFSAGILAGIVCRLTDFLPYEESLWSLPSMATLFGLWIASVVVITDISASNKGAFLNVFLYMFGMTVSFYGLKYILGLYMPMFSNCGEFQTELFVIYSVLSVFCGAGGYILYFWNKKNLFGSFLCALPTGAMLAEAAGCLAVLISSRMLLAQTIFDTVFTLVFAVRFYKKAAHRAVYSGAAAAAAVLLYFTVYRPFLLTV